MRIRGFLISLAVIVLGGALTVVIQNALGVKVEGSFWGRVAYIGTLCAYGILTYKTFEYFRSV